MFSFRSTQSPRLQSWKNRYCSRESVLIAKPTCWLDDTLKAELKAEKFGKCLWRRHLTAAHTANMCGIGIPGREL